MAVIQIVSVSLRQFCDERVRSDSLCVRVVRGEDGDKVERLASGVHERVWHAGRYLCHVGRVHRKSPFARHDIGRCPSAESVPPRRHGHEGQGHRQHVSP